ncbi:MAG: Nif3-like dinuclear metal center hexameric protein, partial [Spirochaetaceae bacterium]
CLEKRRMPIIMAAMNVRDLDGYFRSLLAIDAMREKDVSVNGLQVGRRTEQVERVAFAVDACMETFLRASEWEADMLCVHHGLFWGHEATITGRHYERIRHLIEADLALYAIHLPLDFHPTLGNNAQMAKALELQGVEPFGSYHGTKIGVLGHLPEPLDVGSVCDRLFGDPAEALSVLPFGVEEVRTVALVSGGAPKLVAEAIGRGVDLFITGDASHTVYHDALEAGINVVSGGHYRTETWGVQALADRLAEDTGMLTTFIDVPTGL